MKDKALKLALEALKRNMEAGLTGIKIDEAITAIKEALAQTEQEQCAAKMPCGTTVSNVYQAYEAGKRAALAQPEQEPTCKQSLQVEQEPVAWRNAAIRVGEDLCSVGPFGYYDMTAEQWLDWALSVVTVHAPPQRTWVGLTDEEMWCAYTGGSDIINLDYAKAIEAKLKEKNT